VTPPTILRSEEPQALSTRATSAARAYEMHRAGAAGTKLQLRSQPILHWTNPVPEKQMQGEVFLWTDEGLPAAVLNVFEMNEGDGPREYHEWCCLKHAGLSAVGPRGRKWMPSAGLVSMAPAPWDASPASNPRQRFTQMRELAARFMCRKTNRAGEKQALRMFAQPLVRYESPSQDIIDGGLFVFVEATDPEAFLLLEAISEAGAPAWRFGFARMASVDLEASFDDKVVWKVDTLAYTEYRNRPDLPYTLLTAP
jgi:hypothetical protein